MLRTGGPVAIATRGRIVSPTDQLVGQFLDDLCTLAVFGLVDMSTTCSGVHVL